MICPNTPLKMFNNCSIAFMLRQAPIRAFLQMPFERQEPWLDGAVHRISQSDVLQDEYFRAMGCGSNIIKIIAARLWENDIPVPIFSLAATNTIDNENAWVIVK